MLRTLTHPPGEKEKNGSIGIVWSFEANPEYLPKSSQPCMIKKTLPARKPNLKTVSSERLSRCCGSSHRMKDFLIYPDCEVWQAAKTVFWIFERPFWKRAAKSQSRLLQNSAHARRVRVEWVENAKGGNAHPYQSCSGLVPGPKSGDNQHCRLRWRDVKETHTFAPTSSPTISNPNLPDRGFPTLY